MGVTPNRNYPWPNPADPTKVPKVLEDLALAIDTDVQSQYDRIVTRSVAKAWRVSSPTFITNWVPGTGWFILLDDGFQINTNSAVEVSDTRLIPREPGFWLFTASLSWPVVSLTTPYPQGRHVEVWANGTTMLGRDSFNDDIPVPDVSTETVAVGGRFMNGTTDFIQLAARVFSNNGANLPKVWLNTRAITAIRMTAT